jgi:hypothetical protein
MYARVLNVRTGQVTAAPAAAGYENQWLYSDGRANLIVTQAKGNEQDLGGYLSNLGGIDVYSVPQWKPVLQVSAATVDKVNFQIEGACGGQILASASDQTTVISAYNSSALWSGPASNIVSAQCGPGWILAKTFAGYYEPIEPDLWLLRSGAPFASAIGSLAASVGYSQSQ